MANRIGGEHEIGIEYFMKVRAYISKGVVNRRIRNRTSESSELVRFLIRQHFVRIYRTKLFPCYFLFIIYILRHSSFWQPFYFKSFQNA